MESIVLPIGLLALKLVASPMADKLKLSSERNNETKINLIQGKLSRIKNMLSIIDGRFDNKREDNLKRWINMARNVAYEFADFQDECELAKAKCEKQLLSIPKHVSKVRKSSKIKSIMEHLDETLDLAKTLKLEESKENVSQGRETNAIPYDNERMIGRDDVKGQVIKRLKSKSVEDELNYNVIPIEGMGGIGKTTLAQYVYNSDDIREHFYPKIWVCVSNNFDEKRLTKEIINSIKSNHLSSDDNWNVLQRTLKELLSGKRFLLVLDDVWNHEESEKWQNFKKVFGSGQKGSKILVTTRLPMVSKMVSPKNMDHIVLRELSGNDFWDVFKMFAFQDCDDIDSGLEEIGRKICKKLKGSPLAAKTIGKLLNRELAVTKWKAISDSELWNADQNDTTDIMPALLLSYQHFPDYLKPCFAFFSLFPKGHIFDVEELIGMWGAHGWIKDEGNKLMEDVGKEYLNELLDRSIIQSKKLDKKYPEDYEIQTEEYSMHDLIHDLALFVSKEEYLFVKSDSDCQKISSNIIHLSVDSSCDIERVQKEDLQNLRTFIVIYNNDFYNARDFGWIFVKAKKLRVFKACLSNKHDSDIIKNARHLRYLHLFGISRLPSSFYKLYFLQVLITWEMLKNSKETNRLVNLRHVKSNYVDCCSKGVSNMCMLQELCFSVSNKTGRTIKELKNLNNLKKLSLFHLGQVVSNEDVMESNLMERRRLLELTLSWDFEDEDEDECSSSNNVSEDDVFECLQPPENLIYLHVDNYGGIRSPNWMKNLYLPNLQRIVISECRCWNIEDVSLGHLSNLVYLEIRKMSGVQQLGPRFFGDGDVRGFPSLEILKFSMLENLEEWRMCSDNHPNTQIFPRLQWLEVYECPKMKNIPFQIPSTVRTIKLKSCLNLKFFPSWLQDATCLEELVIKENGVVESFSCNPNMSSLHKLELSYFTELVSLDLGYLNNLKHLEIAHCDNLMSLPENGLPSSLQFLGILDCDNLKSLPENGLPSSLQFLGIDGCDNLKSLPENGLPSSLQFLGISDCNNLMSLPENGLPSSLQDLTISGCDNLMSLPENGLPSSLEHLVISGCNNLKSLPENGLPSSLEHLVISGCNNLKSLPENGLPSSLQSLGISGCNNLKSLPENGLPSSLQDLEISDCDNLKSLPENGLPSSLQDLEISGCDNLKSLPENGLPSSLQFLGIDGCDNLKSLPENGLPSSLQFLGISDCNNLMSLPENGLPSSLQSLTISNCVMLEKRCKEGGADRHKIEHIPNKYID